jgi:predicted dinucleotide-binding enzyme
MHGKIVLDAGNLIPARDGALLDQVRSSGRGTGSYTASLLSGARVVKAFNTVHFKTLEQAGAPGASRVGVPLAGDDPEALSVAAQLVEASDCEPLIIGPLSASARIDFGSPVWNSNMSAEQIARTLSLHPPA